MNTPSLTMLPAAQIDNLLRRELKVGNPNDPEQIARALRERYQGELKAQAIEGEAQGLPFLRTALQRPAQVAALPMASDIDLAQARADVDMDLGQLLTDSLTKDMRPELEGWQQAIRRSIDEGVAAARLGLDPHRRDTAFAMRRQLGDYARLARLIGALTPGLTRSFRHLAQSIDEACAVLLVLMGESMANLGFSGGRYLLQAPYEELQARRDAVLNALRQLDGVAAMVGQGGTWPRGLRAYRQLSTVLEGKGQGDLRALMSEAELARAMDDLIQLSGGESTLGMRALGATAWAPLARLHRFLQTTIRYVTPPSPELATLHEALQLFIEGFVPAGGFRLLRIARPAVLNYGLYGPSHVTAAEQRLIELVNRRGALARQLDCLMECACDRNTVLAQIVLDKLLYDTDRAIDYYCVGEADFGLPELRASAYGLLIEMVTNTALWPWNAVNMPEYLKAITVGPPPSGAIPAAVITELTAIRSLLRPVGGTVTQPPPGWDTTAATYDLYLNQNKGFQGGSPTALRVAQLVHDELCLQRETDMQWTAVVEQMTAGCVPTAAVFAPQGCLALVLDRALGRIEELTLNATDPLNNNASLQVKAACRIDDTTLPPHLEDSLRLIAQKV